MRKSVLLLCFAIIMSMALVSPPILGLDDEILIGGNYPQSWELASFGKACINGAQMAFDEINLAGGVLGKRIRFVVEDNMGTSAGAKDSAEKLIAEDKVILILGPVTSTHCIEGAAPVCQQYRIPMITPTATVAEVTQIGDYIFRGCFADAFHGTVMAKFAIDNLGAKTAAIMMDDGSEYSQSIAASFKQDFIRLGGTVVAEESFGTKDSSHSSQLKRINAQNPDVLFVPGYADANGRIAKQARAKGMAMPIIGGDEWDYVKLSGATGKKALTSVFFSNHYAVDRADEMNLRFVKSYKGRFGDLPDAIAALGYDIARLAVDAIARAHSTDPRAIRDALANTKDFAGVAGNITMGEDRYPIKTAFVFQWQDGNRSYYTEIKP